MRVTEDQDTRKREEQAMRDAETELGITLQMVTMKNYREFLASLSVLV
ncbi:MAG: hypothetical protein AABZ06_02470 [Bdellovibrionota bacterium]